MTLTEEWDKAFEDMEEVMSQLRRERHALSTREDYYKRMWEAQRAENEQFRKQLGLVPVSDEAESEIKKLIEDRDEWKTAAHKRYSELIAANAENAKLREALERIANYGPDRVIYNEVQLLARAALSQSKTPQFQDRPTRMTPEEIIRRHTAATNSVPPSPWEELIHLRAEADRLQRGIDNSMFEENKALRAESERLKSAIANMVEKNTQLSRENERLAQHYARVWEENAKLREALTIIEQGLHSDRVSMTQEALIARAALSQSEGEKDVERLKADIDRFADGQTYAPEGDE
jgi:regulator of replication initiation timing